MLPVYQKLKHKQMALAGGKRSSSRVAQMQQRLPVMFATRINPSFVCFVLVQAGSTAQKMFPPADVSTQPMLPTPWEVGYERFQNSNAAQVEWLPADLLRTYQIESGKARRA